MFMLFFEWEREWNFYMMLFCSHCAYDSMAGVFPINSEKNEMWIVENVIGRKFFFFSFSGVERGGRMRERESRKWCIIHFSHSMLAGKMKNTPNTQFFNNEHSELWTNFFFHPLTFFRNRWNRMRWETQNKVSLKKIYATDFLCFLYLLISLHCLLSMFRKNLYQVFLLLSPFHPMPSVKKYIKYLIIIKFLCCFKTQENQTS